MFDDETSQAAAATDDGVYSFNGSGVTQSREASTVSAATGYLDEELTVFVILRTVCYWVVFTVGVVGNLLVLALTKQLRGHKQVRYGDGTELNF
jgi:hypothetical protein